MTSSSDFNPEEWEAVREGPTSAGLIVATSERGGTLREVFAMAKVYAEARKEHGESELLDELASHRPETDRHLGSSPDEVRQNGLQRIRDAVALVAAKASPVELGEYRQFVVTVAKRVAEAKEERGSDSGISDAESAAIVELEAALGAAGPPSADAA
ncbi:MAG TPA: hypothetical protein VF731_09350 [Solirubrobacterales bacterium]